jgi:hypothetical protein
MTKIVGGNGPKGPQGTNTVDATSVKPAPQPKIPTSTGVSDAVAKEVFALFRSNPEAAFERLAKNDPAFAQAFSRQFAAALKSEAVAEPLADVRRQLA